MFLDRVPGLASEKPEPELAKRRHGRICQPREDRDRQEHDGDGKRERRAREQPIEEMYARARHQLIGSQDWLASCFDGLEHALDLLDDRLRQRGVAERLTHLLAVVGGPPQELDQRLALAWILLLVIQQDV